jgi:DNA-binding XRE family transcriptional regulator
MTQTELANLVGIRREYINRIIHRKLDSLKFFMVMLPSVV